MAAVAAAAPCPPQLSQTARKVAAFRGVEEGLTPPCRWIDAEQLRHELDAKLRRDLPLPPETFLELLARFGLIDGKPAEIYPRLLDFYVSQVLGFYEPGDDSMVLVSSPAASDGVAEAVWAHELAHAAQQHRFGLPARLLAERDNGDAQRAASAIAEGDAMLVMFLLDDTSGGATLATAERMLATQAAATPTPPGLPEYFVAELVFPYTAGFSAVLRRYRADGWDGVDNLLRHPPTSTAALLHPDTPPSGPPITDADLPITPPGWEPVITDTLGEWGLRFLLGRKLPAERASALAAAWVGDRLRMVRRGDRPQQWALAWQLRCRDRTTNVTLAGALRELLPELLGHLPGPGASLELDIRSSGRSTQVRANWPAHVPARILRPSAAPRATAPRSP